MTHIIGPPEAVGSEKRLLVELNGEPFYGLDSWPAPEMAVVDCADNIGCESAGRIGQIQDDTAAMHHSSLPGLTNAVQPFKTPDYANTVK